MSSMYLEPEPSPFGPDGAPESLIEEGRRAIAAELAVRLQTAKIRSGRVMLLADLEDEAVVSTAKRFATYLRDGE